jgi:hypothetical protein
LAVFHQKSILTSDFICLPNDASHGKLYPLLQIKSKKARNFQFKKTIRGTDRTFLLCALAGAWPCPPFQPPFRHYIIPANKLFLKSNRSALPPKVCLVCLCTAIIIPPLQRRHIIIFPHHHRSFRLLPPYTGCLAPLLTSTLATTKKQDN